MDEEEVTMGDYMIAASSYPHAVQKLIRTGKFPVRTKVLATNIVDGVPVEWVHDDNDGMGYTFDEAKAKLPQNGEVAYDVRPMREIVETEEDLEHGTTLDEFVRRWRLTHSDDDKMFCQSEDVADVFGITLSAARNWCQTFMAPAKVAVMRNGRRIYNTEKVIDAFFDNHPDGMFRRGQSDWAQITRGEVYDRFIQKQKNLKL